MRLPTNGKLRWTGIVSASIISLTTMGTMAYHEVQFRDRILLDIQRGDRIEKQVNEINSNVQVLLLEKCLEIRADGTRRLPNECADIIRSHNEK